MLVFKTMIASALPAALTFFDLPLIQRAGHFQIAVCLGFEVRLGAQILKGEMNLICLRIRNSFPLEWLCTRTRFEIKTCSNSEMGYWMSQSSFDLSNLNTFLAVAIF